MHIVSFHFVSFSLCICYINSFQSILFRLMLLFFLYFSLFLGYFRNIAFSVLSKTRWSIDTVNWLGNTFACINQAFPFFC